MSQVMLGEFGHWLLLLSVSLLVVAHVRTVFLGSSDKSVIPSDVFFVASVLPLLLALLTFCFLRDDFSLRYVWENSHTGLASGYKVLALWGGHEGSWLLWCTISSVYAAIAIQTCTELRSEHASVVRITLLALLLYGVFLSNPFARMLPFAPGEGKDLNPLLQDGAMSIHPPCLYLGYCAFLVPFALSYVLPGAQHPDRVCQQIHRWTLWGWGWLTLGICLGSWWAYRELGWGGWWFWDPVENAALIPWLVASALLHVSRGRDMVYHRWTMFLSQACFVLTIVGTWITRSGVLLSVHGFAQAPGRSLGLLIIAVFVCAISFYRWRCWSVGNDKPAVHLFDWREIAAALLWSMALVVLVGTMYPLCAKWLLGQMLVAGSDYFNKAMAPFWLFLLLGMGLQCEAKYRFVMVLPHIVLSLVICVILWWCLSLAILLDFNTVLVMISVHALVAQLHVFFTRRDHLLKNTVHVLVSLLAICICLNVQFASEETFVLSNSEANVMHRNRAFSVLSLPVMHEQTKVIKPFSVRFQNGQGVHELKPSIVFYLTRDVSQSKSDSYSSWFQDINVTMSQMDATHTIMRVQIKPLQKLFWLLGVLLGLVAIASSSLSQSVRTKFLWLYSFAWHQRKQWAIALQVPST